MTNTGEGRSTWSPLAHPLFRLLWIASTASHIGSYMTDVVAGQPSLEAGPIMVQVEYEVAPDCADGFKSAVAELGRSRRRDGAVEWWLFQDTAAPSRFVETWIEETWADHLRNHERVSVAHKGIELRVRELTRGGTAPVTRHFIAPGTRPSAYAAERAIEARTGCRLEP